MMRRRRALRAMVAAAAAIAAGRAALDTGEARAQAASVERIGLLLPKSQGPLARASAALRAGVEAAYKREGRGFAVDLYEVDDSAQQLAAAYRGMLERGTALAIGPLTRVGATSLLQLGDVPITTLALNQIEGDAALPWNVITLSLAVETEARQIAVEAMRSLDQAALRGAPARAIIIGSATPIGKRAAAMFYETWRSLGGEAPLPIELELAGLYKFRAAIKRETGHLFFLAMDTDLARLVRPIIGNAVPAFGTSLLSSGGVSAAPIPELTGVRFVEMPGILSSQYAQRIGYEAVPVDFSLEMLRLYCLGVDAIRVTRAFFSGHAKFDFDGLSGRLSYDGSSSRIERLPALAAYRDGIPVPE